MKRFPCWVCKGKGTWVEVVIEETGQGPTESCNYCSGEGTIEIGGAVHKRIVAERVAMELIRFGKKEEYSYEELLEIGNKALELV
jgi:hypothetical protein